MFSYGEFKAEDQVMFFYVFYQSILALTSAKPMFYAHGCHSQPSL